MATTAAIRGVQSRRAVMVSIFEYEVERPERGRFEQTYGPDGEWAAFFRTGDGYLGTELHRSEQDRSRYLVIDRWASAEAYLAFLETHRFEYDGRSRASLALYRRESVIGRFVPALPPAGLTIERWPGTYAACRLDRAAPVPHWAEGAELCSVTRTADELSIVCPDGAVPEDVVAERGWRCLRVAGPLDFGLTGIAVALTAPLAAAGISVLVIATYDTDYVLIRQAQLDRAIVALTSAGHRVVD